MRKMWEPFEIRLLSLWLQSIHLSNLFTEWVVFLVAVVLSGVEVPSLSGDCYKTKSAL